MAADRKRKLQVQVIHRAGEYFAEVKEVPLRGHGSMPPTAPGSMPFAPAPEPKPQEVIYELDLVVEEFTPRVAASEGNPKS